MKQIVCEMCGSKDLSKVEGVYVCQNCMTKYSVEEARKTMVEGTVDVVGSVKVDNSGMISNYFMLAKDALDSGDDDVARQYINKILEIDHQSYMAWFYLGCLSGETKHFTRAFKNCPENEVINFLRIILDEFECSETHWLIDAIKYCPENEVINFHRNILNKFECFETHWLSDAIEYCTKAIASVPGSQVNEFIRSSLDCIEKYIYEDIFPSDTNYSSYDYDNTFDYDDELFPEAARVIVSSGTASVSMLQRHFKIGYARAGRIIDLLERASIIGPHLGSESRDVLADRGSLEQSERIHGTYVSDHEIARTNDSLAMQPKTKQEFSIAKEEEGDFNTFLLRWISKRNSYKKPHSAVCERITEFLDTIKSQCPGYDLSAFSKASTEMILNIYPNNLRNAEIFWSLKQFFSWIEPHSLDSILIPHINQIASLHQELYNRSKHAIEFHGLRLADTLELFDSMKDFFSGKDLEIFLNDKVEWVNKYYLSSMQNYKDRGKWNKFGRDVPSIPGSISSSTRRIGGDINLSHDAGVIARYFTIWNSSGEIFTNELALLLTGFVEAELLNNIFPNYEKKTEGFPNEDEWHFFKKELNACMQFIGNIISIKPTDLEVQKKIFKLLIICASNIKDSVCYRQTNFVWGQKERPRRKYQWEVKLRTSLVDQDKMQKIIDDAYEKLKPLDPSFIYKTKKPNKSKACYIATAVYGTYDCPQVWTLRRFRDDLLGITIMGRGFIRVYYAISPLFVRTIGKSSLVNSLLVEALDKFVSILQSKGVESTPYTD